jgi:hypothetical protein
MFFCNLVQWKQTAFTNTGDKEVRAKVNRPIKKKYSIIFSIWLLISISSWMLAGRELLGWESNCACIY